MTKNIPKLVDCQGKNFFGNFTPIADFSLKCCIEGQKLKNEITGRSSRERGLRASPTTR